MPENEAMTELQDLDAIASEQDAVLAFRVEDDLASFEPVFVRIFRANVGKENETALIAISDQTGLQLGRYVVSRERHERALECAEEIGEEQVEDQEAALGPLDWQGD